MTRRTLFTALAEVATTLQAECARICFSPHQIALTAIVERLDVIIDQVLEEGVQEDGDSPLRLDGPGLLSLEQWRARDRWDEEPPDA